MSCRGIENVPPILYCGNSTRLVYALTPRVRPEWGRQRQAHLDVGDRYHMHGALSPHAPLQQELPRGRGVEERRTRKGAVVVVSGLSPPVSIYYTWKVRSWRWKPSHQGFSFSRGVS